MTDGLSEYRRKRDFAATPEPAAGIEPVAADENRFVIQRHDARALHFDLRLERDGALASWAVPKGLPLRIGSKRLAVATEDHPLEYLDFAAVIPAGQYGAGRMTIWDHGTYETLLWSDTEIKVVLNGDCLRGEYHLVRTAGREGRDEWLVIRSAKGDPGPDDPLPAYRAMRPMLATNWPEAFDDPAWAFEVKWDGYRALAWIGSDGTELRSRSGRDMTANYPSLGNLRRAISAQEAVLDGEIVVLDSDGRSVFQDLQSSRGAVTFVVFDLLYVDGEWLTQLPWSERRDLLADILTPEGAPVVMRSDDVRGTGTALFGALATRGVEGVVAKRIDSPYTPGGRATAWRKIKVRHETEGFIVGFADGEGSRRGGIGALLLAQAGDDELTYIGRVGSGLSDATSRDLRHRLERLAVDACPLSQSPSDTAGVQWVRPELVCRATYSEWTTDGVMRAPVFLGLAEHEPPDRPPPVLDLSRNELRVRDEEREIRLTNLGKVFWSGSGLSKGDLLDHYARVASFLVPHLEGRPMVLKRYPNGWDQPFFFQHQMPDTAPDWLTRVVLTKGGDAVTYIVVNDPLDLLWVVNLGCIDLNPWHAHAATADKADYVLFDLDPQEGVSFDSVIDVSLEIRMELDTLGLVGHPKTSGSRGIHILVPIVPIAHESVRLFAQVVAQRVVARRPQLATVETSIARRGRRVYIDANQNGYGKTIASVYSVRPVAGATVSTPLEWDEVAAGFDPTRLTMAAVADRLSRHGDLFSGVLHHEQDLAAAVARLA